MNKPSRKVIDPSLLKKNMYKRIAALVDENEALKKKLLDGLSCCCSGCSRHNQDLINPSEDKKDEN